MSGPDIFAPGPDSNAIGDVLQAVTMENVFYVYEHWRPDRDVCFYVGKGKDDRAYIFRRIYKAAGTGKKHSAETRAKMSASRMGNKNGTGGKGLRRSEETKARMSAAQKGHPVSEETKAKISAILKRVRCLYEWA